MLAKFLIDRVQILGGESRLFRVEDPRVLPSVPVELCQLLDSLGLFDIVLD